MLPVMILAQIVIPGTEEEPEGRTIRNISQQPKPEPTVQAVLKYRKASFPEERSELTIGTARSIPCPNRDRTQSGTTLKPG